MAVTPAEVNAIAKEITGRELAFNEAEVEVSRCLRQRPAPTRPFTVPHQAA